MPTVPHLWEDAFHFVRPASIKDRHPLRFVLVAKRTTGEGGTKRRYASLEEAGDGGVLATKALLRRRPELAGQHAAVPVLEERASPVMLQPFATTHFRCSHANPVAQIWVCIDWPGSKAPVGRRRKDGRAPQQTAVLHEPGEFAVLVGDEPVRDPLGRVIRFRRGDAEDKAQELYDTCPPEDTISWHEGQARVGGTLDIDIMFDPSNNGELKPFNLWIPRLARPVWVDVTKAVEFKGAGFASKDEERAARAANRRMNREASLVEKVLLFKSITGAQATAEERQAMLDGSRLR